MQELKLKQRQFKDRFDSYLKQLGAVGDDVYSRCTDFLVMGYRLIIQDAYSERKVDLADTYQTAVFNCSQKDYLDILTNANPKNSYYREICDLYADYSTQLGEFCQQITRNINEYNYINVEATYEVMDEYREHMKDFVEFVLGEPAGLPVINFANTIEDRIVEMLENTEFDTPAMPALVNEKVPDSRMDSTVDHIRTLQFEVRNAYDKCMAKFGLKDSDIDVDNWWDILLLNGYLQLLKQRGGQLSHEFTKLLLGCYDSEIMQCSKGGFEAVLINKSEKHPLYKTVTRIKEVDKSNLYRRMINVINEGAESSYDDWMEILDETSESFERLFENFSLDILEADFNFATSFYALDLFRGISARIEDLPLDGEIRDNTKEMAEDNDAFREVYEELMEILLVVDPELHMAGELLLIYGNYTTMKAYKKRVLARSEMIAADAIDFQCCTRDEYLDLMIEKDEDSALYKKIAQFDDLKKSPVMKMLYDAIVSAVCGNDADVANYSWMIASSYKNAQRAFALYLLGHDVPDEYSAFSEKLDNFIRDAYDVGTRRREEDKRLRKEKLEREKIAVESQRALIQQCEANAADIRRHSEFFRDLYFSLIVSSHSTDLEAARAWEWILVYGYVVALRQIRSELSDAGRITLELIYNSNIMTISEAEFYAIVKGHDTSSPLYHQIMKFAGLCNTSEMAGWADKLSDALASDPVDIGGKLASVQRSLETVQIEFFRYCCDFERRYSEKDSVYVLKRYFDECLKRGREKRTKRLEQYHRGIQNEDQEKLVESKPKEKAPDSRETLMVEPEPDDDDAVYEYCSVIFKHGIQPYAYLTGGIQVEVGDTVIVPVGPDPKERKATVVSVGKYMRIVAPYPPEKTSTIMRVE